MSVTVSVQGGLELEKILMELGNPRLARRIGKTALEFAAEPIIVTAKSLVRDDPKTAGMLRDSINRKTRARQDTITTTIGINVALDPPKTMPRKSGKGTWRDPGVSGNAVFQEFGTEAMGAKPFMRPAWDSNKDRVVSMVAQSLKVDLDIATGKLKTATPTKRGAR